MEEAHLWHGGATLRSALVVDDHPLFADALLRALRLGAGIGEARVAGTFGEALGLLDRGLAPDLVILDLDLPDRVGIDGLRTLRGLGRDIRVLAVAPVADTQTMSAALSAGAVAVVAKTCPRAVFQRALQSIARGEVFMSPGRPDAALPADTIVPPAPEPLSALTPQQRRILQRICEGKLNKQIAFELSIAETTVKAHVTAIMRKLRVQSRTQAVLMVQQAAGSGAAAHGAPRRA